MEEASISKMIAFYFFVTDHSNIFPGISSLSYISISQEEESSPQSPCTKQLRAAALFCLSFFVRRHCDQRRISNCKRFGYRGRCGWRRKEIKKKSNWKGYLQHGSRSMFLRSLFHVSSTDDILTIHVFMVKTESKEHRRTPRICSILAITLSAVRKKTTMWYFTPSYQGKWEIRWIVWKEVPPMLITIGQTRPLV